MPDYFFDLGSTNSQILLETIELKKALDFNLNNPQIKIILDEILLKCDSLILFGSYARNKQNEHSDLDLIIINGNDKEIKDIIKKQVIEINYENISLNEFEDSLKKNNPLI